MFSNMILGLGLASLALVSEAQITTHCAEPRPGIDCSPFIATFCQFVGANSVPPHGQLVDCFLAQSAGGENSCEFLVINQANTTQVPGVARCTAVLTALNHTCPEGSAQAAGDSLFYQYEQSPGVVCF
ncbi:hypothetical protein DFH09DRAFT_393655 [Mycena vulgaris]|nr:hypothetical protein DFH09DRAFT_393655 [Mycena vulgaris]